MNRSEMKNGMRVCFSRPFSCDERVVGDVTVPVGALATITEVAACYVIVRPDDQFPDLVQWCNDEAEGDYQLHVFDEEDDGDFPFEPVEPPTRMHGGEESDRRPLR